MLKLTAIGNLGRDAEIRDVNGKRVINFSIAHSEKFKDQNGVQNERTTWVKCAMWRDADKTKVAQYLTKGTRVYVEGMPAVSAYISRDGESRASLELRVTNLELLGSKEESGQARSGGSNPAPEEWKTQKPAKSPKADGAAPSAAQMEAQTPLEEEEDLPF